MDETKKNMIAGYYDVSAADYARKYYHELDSKPFDRTILTRFAKAIRPKGLVCDIGCGPGEVAVFLQNEGCTVVGLDLSNEMVRLARRLCPEIPFEQGDMTDLRFEDNSLSGITAFYSIVHFTHNEIEEAVGEFYRVLEPGGLLLLSFHIGTDVLHICADADPKAEVDFYFLDPAVISGLLRGSGLLIEECTTRPAYPQVEYQSTRAYMMARKKG